MKTKITALLIFGGIAIAVGATALAYFGGPTGEEIRVGLGRGQSLLSLADTLKAKGVIESPALFLLFLRITGKEGHVKAGYYIFRKRDHEWRAVKKILTGPNASLEVRVTIPEGTTGAAMAGLFSDSLGLDSAEFCALMRDKRFIDSLAETYPYLKGLSSLEGFLFPDTYFFYKGEKPRAVIARMVDRHFSFWTPERLSAAEELRMTVGDIVVLASLVESETKLDEERPVVASVFLNRLARKMPLASNSALGYVLSKNPAWLSGEDLEINSPYNTYKRLGLPPTAICSPGLKSIDAVLHPARTNYLFFVATGEGNHLFSATYEEHQRNVARARENWNK
ncbi:MAG: endolytic transglycosylase MltG [candidate division WOR-3 bacterium]